MRLTTAQLIAEKARQRGIKVQDHSSLFEGFFQLVWGEHWEVIYYSSSDLQGHITYRICSLKPLTNVLLREGGFPVPADQVVSSLSEALAFLQQRQRIVVKPLSGTGGVGITPGVSTEEGLRFAFQKALQANTEEDQRVLCQQHVEGRDFRLLVINRKQVLAMERVPASVAGDGKQTVRELVEARNQTYPSGYHIQLREDALELLSRFDLSLGSVLAAGQQVRLAKVANAHAGGTVRDVTDLIHPEVRAMACQVAEHFRMPVVGIDWIASDIAEPSGMIIELNATPDFTIHFYPDEGKPRDAAGPFLDMLFPETKSS